MIVLDPADERLSGLLGLVLPSPTQWGVSYQIVRPIAVGGMAAAMLALRESDAGVGPVVLKILTPSFVRGAGREASVSIQKEAEALRRLNERVPPTPFVVGLVEAGVLEVSVGSDVLVLGWLALEYVHGGAEGTTLTDRVAYSINTTGAAFDPLRAADAVKCIASGLTAVHDCGVIHRDLKPSNVLCCGFGDREILKIADFGLARPDRMNATFEGTAVGTPGYSAPEQLYGSTGDASPASDVFGMAAVVFFILTGHDMFSFKSLPDMVNTLQQKERPKLAEAAQLAPALKHTPTACDAIDAVLLRATSFGLDDRPPTAQALAEQVLEPLLAPKRLSRTTVTRLPKPVDSVAPTDHSWTWLKRHREWPDGVVQSAAFDGDGHCLAATTRGLAFWDGSIWRPALPVGQMSINFDAVRRTGPANWVIASTDGELHSYSVEGLQSLAEPPAEGVRFHAISGSPSQMLLLSGTAPNQGPALYRLTRGGWLDPVPLELATVNTLSRISTTTWLVGGRTHEGRGYLALVTPLDGGVEALTVPDTRAFVSSAADPERGTAVAVGTGGTVVWFDGHHLFTESVPTETPLSVAGVDVSGGFWAGGTGQLWYRAPGAEGNWRPAWRDTTWLAPLACVYADAGVAMALSATGAVLEGLSSAARRASR